MKSITPIVSAKPRRSLSGVCESVMRAKQIVRAIRVASEHDQEIAYQHALEQVEDMLSEAREALRAMEATQGLNEDNGPESQP